MLEYCTCGLSRANHPALLDYIPESITTADEAYALKQQQFIQERLMQVIFGRVCKSYKRDNLRYVEHLEKARNSRENIDTTR